MKRVFLLAAVLAAVACEPKGDAVADSTLDSLTAPTASRASVAQIDSIAIPSSLQNPVTNAPDSCKNGSFTGCPTFRFGDFVEGYSNGSLVGYVSGVKCSSSNEAVATVNAKCYATVVGQGTAVITITYDHGRLSTATTITAN